MVLQCLLYHMMIMQNRAIKLSEKLFIHIFKTSQSVDSLAYFKHFRLRLTDEVKLTFAELGKRSCVNFAGLF